MLPVILLGFAQLSGNIRLLDGFGRDVTTHGFTLLDWDGRLANPAVPLRVALPPGTAYPVDVYIHSDSTRVHFDRSDNADRYGIGRKIHLGAEIDSAAFHAALFPDRTARSGSSHLYVQVFNAARQETARIEVPLQIDELPWQAPAHPYPIIVDFGQDKTGFTKSPQVQKVIRQVVEDWDYFLEDQGEDPVAAGAEQSQSWDPDGFKNDSKVSNRSSYRGFLLYYQGIDGPEWRSGGQSSPYGQLQTANGVQLPLCRSGTVDIQVPGNYNRLGWFLRESDDDWWVSGNNRAEQNDLYSILLHETGHALAFNKFYPRFGDAKSKGQLSSPDLTDYLHSSPSIDPTDHFPGLIDPVSGYGAFGNEYNGWMNTRRWLITKASLLCMEAVGYRIRKDAAFQGLRAPAPTIQLYARQGQQIEGKIGVTGGVPEYFFKVVSGALPEGVSTDSFTGALTGAPTKAGSYSAEISVADNDPTAQPLTVSLKITVS